MISEISQKSQVRFKILILAKWIRCYEIEIINYEETLMIQYGEHE